MEYEVGHLPQIPMEEEHLDRKRATRERVVWLERKGLQLSTVAVKVYQRETKHRERHVLDVNKIAVEP